MTTIIFKNPMFLLKSSALDKIDDYINEFLSLLPEGVGDRGVEEMLSPEALLSELISVLEGSGGRIGRFFALLMLSVIVAYLASVYEGRLSGVAVSAACIISLSPAVYELLALADEVAEGLTRICAFFSSLIPLILSVLVAGGAANSSAAMGMQMSLVASAVQAVSSELLLPMVRAVLILGGVSSLGGAGAERVTSLLRWILTRGLGLISVVVTALFSLQSIIASASDSAALRLAKFTAQSLAPSVGAIIGSSMSAISSGLSYARGIIGGGAIAAVLWIMLSPLAMLLLYRLAVGLCLGFADSLGVKPLSRALSVMQYALEGLISVFLTSGVMFLLQFIIFIKCGVEV